jgi:uncharacterized protein
MNPTLSYVLAVVFLATLIRSAIGFGEALVAVPLLALQIPVRVAAPLAVLVSITVAAIVIAQDWRHIHIRAAGWLVLWTALGIPLGLLLLVKTDQRVIKAILGIVIVAFCVHSLFKHTRLRRKRESALGLFVAGFSAGVLGGAYGMNGPPLAIYGAMRRWSAQHFRATLQAYFLPASLIGMGGYWVAGLWVSQVTRYYLLSLPVVLAAILLGRAINRRLHGQAFLIYVYLGLAGIGVTLFVQSL